jgi:hypothetical protein
MPIVTRTVAKGIPPRLREPKSKAHKKEKLTKKHTRKRSADSESEGDEEEHTSDDSLVVYKKEKHRRHKVLDSDSLPAASKKQKRRRIEALNSDSEDLEIVEKDTSEPPAEEVDMYEDEVGVQQPPSELEVSMHHHLFRFRRLTI